MQKKLIALAVAGLASSAAFAQSNVTIYGSLKPSFDSVSVDGDATRANTYRDNNSLIGFKGEEALGNGLKAIFQVESGLNLSLARGTDSQGSLLGGRDSWLGFAGSFGSITFGRHQSAYVRSTNTNGYDPFADSIGDYNNIMGVDWNAGADFNTRWNQSAYYTSPVWSGFQVLASYALNDPDTTKASKAENVLSLAGVYNNGPLGLVLAYEEQGQSQGTGVGDLKAWKLGAKYKFSFGTTLSGLYENIKSTEFFGAEDLDRDAYGLALTHPITSTIDLKAAYLHADESGNDRNDGANNFTVGATYKFSKRTNVSALYSRISNKENGNYGFDSNGIDPSFGSGAGADLSAFSVRLQHNF